jgi:hypothetical protein
VRGALRRLCPGGTRGLAGVAFVALLAVGACGGRRAPPPEPGTVRGFAPDLRGRRVLVLPVQQVLGVPGGPDAELAFALRERGVGVTWIFPADVEAVLARSPGVQARTQGLQVGDFLVAEVTRVGDPLYGELRRLAALVDAEAIFLPIQAALSAEPGVDPRVRVWATLLEVRTGRVLWFAFLEGQSAPAGDPAGLASAVEQVTRTLLWYAVGP